MKTIKLFFKILLLSVIFASCEKDEEEIYVPPVNYVTVKIDYLGDGGSYNDNINGVPYGLEIGSNGPYIFDAPQTYTISYRPSNNWSTPITLEWSPAGNGRAYEIHCYVEGNTGHVTARSL